ncbi:MAG: hypothetical protein ABIJ44_07835 [Pseudomonadota bacterium]
MKDSIQYRLPQIPYLHLRFGLSSQKEALLPRFKGSLLRGAYGNALRRMVCVMGANEHCEDCMLRGQCIYCRAFETFINGTPPPLLRGLQTGPRPFAIDAFDGKRLFRKNESLQFDLVLFGQAIEMYPYTIYAVSKMAECGLGNNRYPFKLEEVLWLKPDTAYNPQNGDNWRPLYESTSNRLIDNPEKQFSNPAYGQIRENGNSNG